MKEQETAVEADEDTKDSNDSTIIANGTVDLKIESVEANAENVTSTSGKVELDKEHQSPSTESSKIQTSDGNAVSQEDGSTNSGRSLDKDPREIAQSRPPSYLSQCMSMVIVHGANMSRKTTYATTVSIIGQKKYGEEKQIDKMECVDMLL